MHRGFERLPGAGRITGARRRRLRPLLPGHEHQYRGHQRRKAQCGQRRPPRDSLGQRHQHSRDDRRHRMARSQDQPDGERCVRREGGCIGRRVCTRAGRARPRRCGRAAGERADRYAARRAGDQARGADQGSRDRCGGVSRARGGVCRGRRGCRSLRRRARVGVRRVPGPARCRRDRSLQRN